jgi:uncharacterized protein
MRGWFAERSAEGWATCSFTEAGFVRVSSNPAVLPSAIGVRSAREVLAALRGAGAHRFLANDVSLVDDDVPAVTGHRQVTDVVLLTVARRHGVPLVTFDAGIEALAGGSGVQLLRL